VIADSAESRWFFAGIVASALAAALAIGLPQNSPAQAPATAEVLLVGNNWDGTVDLIDPQTFEHIDQIDVAPDLAQRLAKLTPAERVARLLNNEFAAEGNDQLVDDMRVSPDGGTLYISRPSLGDVVAFDMVTGAQVWRVNVSGFRADHMALSPDGSELLVSATTANVIDVIDTSTATIVDRIPAGTFPHENEYSEDGELIYNGSIGNVILPDPPLLDRLKGRRWFTIADADTHEVVKVIDFKRGVRPFVVLPDERTMYVQLSFFHGFVEYDLETQQTLRTVNLPIPPEVQNLPRDQYPLDSAHHGLALNDDFTKICDAGTVSDYVAILTRASLTVDAIIPVGDVPYWATSSSDGQYCFVSNSGSDNLSVISFDAAEEVARIPVGDHPQRARVATVQLPAG
jgi:YVTN family beta-propeller protein